MDDEALDIYDAEHIREALAHDARVGALDVHVRVSGGALVVTGNVPTADRRDAITAVVAELAPDAEVRNDVAVTDMSEPPGQEVIR